MPNRDELRWRDANRGRFGLVLDAGGALVEVPVDVLAAVATVVPIVLAAPSTIVAGCRELSLFWSESVWPADSLGPLLAVII